MLSAAKHPYPLPMLSLTLIYDLSPMDAQ